jgi:hypothetical protein
MDFLGYSDYYDSFTDYQTRMLAAFDQLGREYGFRDMDANQSIGRVFAQLRDALHGIVSELKPKK